MLPRTPTKYGRSLSLSVIVSMVRVRALQEQKKLGTIKKNLVIHPSNSLNGSQIPTPKASFIALYAPQNMASTLDKQGSKEDVLFLELPAPPGWNKKFLPKLDGITKKNEIIFIAPTGEEFHSKRQLDQYLKSHPGSPASSEFDWGTGETPRRSTRISEKVKAATPSPQIERPKKRTRKRALSKKDDDKEADVVPDGFGEAGVHKEVETDVDGKVKEIYVEGNDENRKLEDENVKAKTVPATAESAEEGRQIDGDEWEKVAETEHGSEGSKDARKENQNLEGTKEEGKVQLQDDAKESIPEGTTVEVQRNNQDKLNQSSTI